MRVSENRTENNQPSVLRKTTGITVGAAIGLSPVAMVIQEQIKPFDDKKIAKIRNNVSKLLPEMDSFENIQKYADKIIAETGLKDKNLKIEIWSPDALKKNNPLPEAKTIWQKFKNMKEEKKNKILEHGLNAYFSRSENKIKLNKTRLYSTVFHEIGHAMNFHLNPFTKMLQKVRAFNQSKLPLFATACLGVGLFTDKRTKQQKSQEHNKFKDFVHNNAGKLILLYGAPVVAEEALASRRGIKAAKKYLTPAQNQMHVKNLSRALGTYINTVLLIAGALALGIFVKDKIVGPKKLEKAKEEN